MERFKKILVGVDLSWADCLVAEELSAPNEQAVSQALWLAELNSASVDFLFSLDLTAMAQRLIAESPRGEATILDQAKKRLAELVARAQERGIRSESEVVFGKSWLELIRKVLRQQHDLVLVGTRHLDAVQQTLLGSTGVKLLRKCPCAVWVTQPQTEGKLDSILVAHDLRPVGDLAMSLGCSLAKLEHAQLHVLHADEFPEFDSTFSATIQAEHKQAYRETADEHITQQLASAHLPRPAEVHFVTERPDVAIMKCVEQHDVDLIVMGTLGRSGISGFITGNTAERLLPRISCSVLAVKPRDFVSPVKLECQIPPT